MPTSRTRPSVRRAPGAPTAEHAAATASAAALIESSHDAVLTETLDGTIQGWNSAAERLYGYRADEIVGRPIDLLIPPDRAGELRGILDRIARGQRVDPFDTVRVRKDGIRIDVSVSVSPLRDPRGRITGAAAIARDIGERQRAAETLRRIQREFRHIFDHASLGIYRASREGRILLANQAFATMLGYDSPDELHTLDMARDVYLDPHEREALIARHEAVGRAWTVEVPWKKRDGTPFWVMATVHVIKDDAGRTMYFETFAQDVTERRRLEAERDALSHRLIAVQEQERRDLARELHDEIGQLLTGLKLMIEGRGTLGGPLEMTQLLREVSARVRDVSHHLRPPMLDELGLLPTLQWHLERYTQRTGVRVYFSHAGCERRFPDEVEMAVFRIVQEALTNVARHAGVDEADVTVEAFADRFRVRVEDRGVGFEAQAVTAPAARGLRGMRERVRLLGGTFSIQAAPGAGTRITACVPFVPSSSGMLV